MAYGAPYYLDTTEISKLTAYYGDVQQDRALLEHPSVRFSRNTYGGVLPSVSKASTTT